MYAQPGQPDVDLPVSPADAPVPSVTNDDSILRCVYQLGQTQNCFRDVENETFLDACLCVHPQAEHEAGEV